MVNLIKMDLYRVNKLKSVRVCLIIAAVLALLDTPFNVLLTALAKLFSTEVVAAEKTVTLSSIINNPFPLANGMLALLAACYFFYADVENGYIKNIAGQMPRKGYTILSKFAAMIAVNLTFMIVGIVFNLIGTAFFKKIVVDDGTLSAIGLFFVRFLLIQSLGAILLLVVSAFGSKSLGTVLSVLFGMELMSLIYMGIDAGLNQVFKSKNFAVADYMPDQLLANPNLSALTGIIVAVITGALFLLLAIRIVDRKDVK